MQSVTQEAPFLTSLLDMLEAQLGESCEIVLHNLENGYDHTILDIRNGHITQRNIGDCGSNLGLQVLRDTEINGNRFNYLTKTVDGKTLRSSTMFITRDDGKVIGAICINKDITKLLDIEKALQIETGYSRSEINGNSDNNNKEVFVNNVNELLDYLIQEALHTVNKPVSLMDREDKQQVLRYLDEKGAFIISKSGDRVCDILQISKYTLYNYLDSVRKNNVEKNGISKALVQ